MIEVEPLLQAIEGESPTGPDLDLDGDVAYSTFVNVTAAGKQEQAIGDSVIPAEDPDWKLVEREALELLARSKDLRLAIPLTMSLTARGGLPGLAQGIALIRGLVENFWIDMHPRLEGADDPFRVLRLGDLNADGALIRLLRSTVIAEARSVGRFTFRELALADGEIQPREGESSVNVDMLIGAIREGDVETVASTRTALDQTLIDLDQIVAVFNANSNGPPDFDRLIGMLKRGQTLVAQATANANDESGADEGSAGHDGGESGGGGGGGPGRLRNRADAKRALEQICEFLERTEPGHPAPIFARRAVKLLDMNFLEIINELAPDSLPRVHDLGGIVPPE